MKNPVTNTKTELSPVLSLRKLCEEHGYTKVWGVEGLSGFSTQKFMWGFWLNLKPLEPTTRGGDGPRKSTNPPKNHPLHHSREGQKPLRSWSRRFPALLVPEASLSKPLDARNHTTQTPKKNTNTTITHTHQKRRKVTKTTHPLNKNNTNYKNTHIHTKEEEEQQHRRTTTNTPSPQRRILITTHTPKKQHHTLFLLWCVLLF